MDKKQAKNVLKNNNTKTEIMMRLSNIISP